MACNCSKSYTLNLEVKYSFDFSNPEDLELRLKSIFDTTKTTTDRGVKLERVIHDCEGFFTVQSGRVSTRTNIRPRERDDDGDLLGLDSDIWKTLSSCVLREIKRLFDGKSDIRVSLDFKITEATEMIYR